MPEILGDAGIYFDPERPSEIAAALRTLIESPELRAEKADAAFRRAKGFSWDRCAEETFGFLIRTMKRYRVMPNSGTPLPVGRWISRSGL